VIVRRKSLPPELVPAHDAFLQVLREIEPAKAELTEVVPSTRLPGRPLADALVVFEAGLRRGAELMPAWRRTELEAEWSACEAGLRRAMDLAARLLSEAPELGGFGGLLGVVQDLLDPLEPFEAASQAFAARRVRLRRP
jgi:hypothetical protein